jgi:hypothetical protein
MKSITAKRLLITPPSLMSRLLFSIGHTKMTPIGTPGRQE